MRNIFSGALAACLLLVASSCAIQSSPALAVDPAPPAPIVHVVPLANTSRIVASPAVAIPTARPTPAQNAAHVVDIIKARAVALNPLPPLAAVDRAHVLDKIRTSAIHANEWREAKVDGKWFTIGALLFVFLLAVGASLVDYFKHHHAASLPHVEIAPLLEKAAADANHARAKLVAEAEGAHVGQTIAKAEEWVSEAWHKGVAYADREWAEIVAKRRQETSSIIAAQGFPIAPASVLASADVPIEPSVEPVVVVEHVEHVEPAPAVVEQHAGGEGALDVLPTADRMSIKEARAKVNSLSFGTPEYAAAFDELQAITVDAVKKAS